MSLLSLPAVLDTAAAPPLHAELVARVDRAEPIALDGSAVTKAGLACLQVLAAARAVAVHRGLAFDVAQPSAPLREMVSLARLDVLLERVG